MKLINILNKIAKDEELPDKIMFFGHKFIYDKTTKTYRSVIDNKPIGEMFILEYCLNFKVKIIEDKEKKIPEKEDELIGYNIQDFDNLKEFVEITANDVFGKINKIINKQNKIIDYLKSKGE